MLLDASVVITYLASPAPERTAVAEVLRLAVNGSVDLLWIEGLTGEVERTVRLRASVRKRVSREAVVKVLRVIRSTATVLPPSAGPALRVCRDPNDDYLVAAAVAGRVDLVVTLDDDLLAHDGYAGVRFVKPGAALAIIRDASGRPGE